MIPTLNMNNLGMPLKVLHKTHELGIHNDCLAAGPDKECASCTETVVKSFDAFYGHLPTDGDRVTAIVKDMLNDRGML